MSFDLTAADPAAHSGLGYSFALARYASKYRSQHILVVAFTGVYGFGSGGNDDGDYMGTIVELGTRAFSPAGVVLDLRGLDYRWGDAMSAPLAAAGADGVQPAFVISGLCHEGMTSYVEMEMGEPAGDWLFGDLDEAIARVERSRREYEEASDLVIDPIANAALLPRLDPDVDPTTGNDGNRRFRMLAWSARRRSIKRDLGLDRALLIAMAKGMVLRADGDIHFDITATHVLADHELRGLDPLLAALEHLPSLDRLDITADLPLPLLDAILAELADREVSAQVTQATRILTATRTRRAERLAKQAG